MGIDRWKSCFATEPVERIGDTDECFDGEPMIGAGANIGFRADRALYEECRRTAQEERISFSRLVREALREKLKRIEHRREICQT